ncbi:MAG: hypothetical protein HY738_12890, partial [Bacteroidia bacterium]|nr:hypothetical protein [Bacteroidia bacterium]
MNSKIIEWLLTGPAWLRYAVELQLLGNKPEVKTVLQDEQIKPVIRRLKDNRVGIPALPTGKVSYISTGNAYWDLFFLADIGLNAAELDIGDEIEHIFKLQRPDKMFITEQYTKPN